MPGGLLLYTSAALAILGVAFTYWSRAPRRRASRANLPTVSLVWITVGLGLASCLWSVYLERPALSYEHRVEPLALAIAFDLSPSMLAIPHPEVAPEALPRYLRGRNALLGLLQGIEEREAAAIVAIVGFTRHADVMMGWNRNIRQAREVIHHALSPEVFNGSGSSIEAATDALTDVFQMLPPVFDNARRLAIIVSDGEDTMRKASFGYAIDTISRAGFEVIALQTGALDADEGVPVYDRRGSFEGFERIGGELYTRPDVTVMEALARAHPDRGLYLRAEAQGASRYMLDFAYGATSGRNGFDTALLPTLGMFGAVLVLLAWIIR